MDLLNMMKIFTAFLLPSLPKITSFPVLFLEFHCSELAQWVKKKNRPEEDRLKIHLQRAKFTIRERVRKKVWTMRKRRMWKGFRWCECGDLFGEENGNLLRYSCLGKSVGRGAWQAYSPWGRKELDTT